MDIKYFKDTDTLYIVFNKNKVFDTIDVSKNVLADLDAKGRIVSLTIEHSKEQTNISNFSVDINPEISKKVLEFA